MKSTWALVNIPGHRAKVSPTCGKTLRLHSMYPKGCSMTWHSVPNLNYISLLAVVMDKTYNTLQLKPQWGFFLCKQIDMEIPVYLSMNAAMTSLKMIQCVCMESL